MTYVQFALKYGPNLRFVFLRSEKDYNAAGMSSLSLSMTFSRNLTAFFQSTKSISQKILFDKNLTFDQKSRPPPCFTNFLRLFWNFLNFFSTSKISKIPIIEYEERGLSPRIFVFKMVPKTVRFEDTV